MPRRRRRSRTTLSAPRAVRAERRTSKRPRQRSWTPPIGSSELDCDLSDVPARPVPGRVGDEQQRESSRSASTNGPLPTSGVSAPASPSSSQRCRGQGKRAPGRADRGSSCAARGGEPRACASSSASARACPRAGRQSALLRSRIGCPGEREVVGRDRHAVAPARARRACESGRSCRRRRRVKLSARSGTIVEVRGRS